MKRYVLGLFAVIALMAMPAGCSSQGKYKSTPDETAQVHEKIESGDYTIDVNWVIPSRGRSFSPTSQYSLTVRNDSVFSYLPYFGRAYSLPYGGGEGLVFEAPMKDYRMAYGRKDQADITFEARTREDTYRFRIEVFPNGSSSIMVQPNNKQSISFGGDLNMKGKKEK